MNLTIIIYETPACTLEVKQNVTVVCNSNNNKDICLLNSCNIKRSRCIGAQIHVGSAYFRND